MSKIGVPVWNSDGTESGSFIRVVLCRVQAVSNANARNFVKMTDSSLDRTLNVERRLK